MDLLCAPLLAAVAQRGLFGSEDELRAQPERLRFVDWHPVNFANLEASDGSVDFIHIDFFSGWLGCCFFSRGTPKRLPLALGPCRKMNGAQKSRDS